ncbi:MAG: M15 family metallopeptidase [Treponema sp.]|jgi:hypothetical protein|nr:M15 family metallopeptidase [Treponema sp.]
MNKAVFYIGVFLVLTVGSIFILGSRYISAGENTILSAETEQLDKEQAMNEPTRAEQVMRALAEAYQQQIEQVEFRNDDWAVLLRDTWYFYAGGRLLPENLLENASDYNPTAFYNYRPDLPEWRTPTPEESERYRNMTNNRNRNPIRRSPHFFDDLWRARSHSESYERMKTMRFLGHTVTVHYLIMENLSLVEEQIRLAAKADSQVQTWINSISKLEGWSWRNIAETQSRSYHAYGLAVDIIPRSYGGRETYWLWASGRRTDWWNISYNERYHPPQAVIKAFENYGFVWGGKWAYFDTMHFEYRPEVLILSGMPPETRR